jgi:hypothetical protein
LTFCKRNNENTLPAPFFAKLFSKHFI